MDGDNEEMHRNIRDTGFLLLLVYVLLATQTEFMAVIFKRFSTILFAFTRNLDITYSLLPVYLNWIISDYFQERKGTSLGNAASNGFTGAWVGIDWIRAAHHRYLLSNNFEFLVGKLLFALLMLGYGAIVLREAALGRKLASYIGRIRTISYVAIMLTPIVYEVVKPDFTTLLTVILFFPLCYGLAEFVIYYLLPPPKTEE